MGDNPTYLSVYTTPEAIAEMRGTRRKRKLEAHKERVAHFFDTQALPLINRSMGPMGITNAEVTMPYCVALLQGYLKEGPVANLSPAQWNKIDEILNTLKTNPDALGITFPPYIRKVLTEINPASLRYQVARLILQVEGRPAVEKANKEALAKSIAEIKAITTTTLVKAEEERKQKEREKNSGGYYYYSTTAVLDCQHFFVPNDSIGLIEYLEEEEEAVKEDLADLPIEEPLPEQLQGDIVHIFRQIDKDQATLTPLYKQMQKWGNNADGDAFCNEVRQKKIVALMAEVQESTHKAAFKDQLKWLKKEAEMIEKEKKDATLARKLLAQYDEMRENLQALLAERHHPVMVAHVVAYAVEEADEGSSNDETTDDEDNEGSSDNGTTDDEDNEGSSDDGTTDDEEGGSPASLQSALAQAFSILYAESMVDETVNPTHDWEKDYSQEELKDYLSSCFQVPRLAQEKAFAVEAQSLAADTFSEIIKRFTQPASVTTQEFCNLWQTAPKLNQLITAYYPDGLHTERYTGILLHALLASGKQPIEGMMQVRQCNEIKRRVHKLKAAISQGYLLGIYGERNEDPSAID
jgi:hypothetical protein